MCACVFRLFLLLAGLTIPAASAGAAPPTTAPPSADEVAVRKTLAALAKARGTSEIAVLTGALAEVRASIGNVTAFVPRRK